MPEQSGARPQSSPRLSVLRDHPLFRELDSAALDQLCRYASSRKFTRGATIFAKGDPGNSLFAVASGSVKMSISSVEGRSAILNLIGKGEIFGEIALLDGLPRTTDATAHTNCDLIVIDRRDFLPFIRKQPPLAMKFIELLCARLRWTSEQIEHVMLQDLPGRLASVLIGLADRRQPTSAGGPIAITQQEIGEMVGMSRESINKQLRAWATSKWVRLEHGAILIMDRAALAAVAGNGHATAGARDAVPRV
jgi:CRP/FNR family cyclic AMP-dependent transcriptional regulator